MPFGNRFAAAPSGASLLNPSLTSAVFGIMLAFGSWGGTGCKGDYIIPAAFPGQWLNRMAAEAELDRPSSFSLQHLHGDAGLRKRTPEQYDETMTYSVPESRILISTGQRTTQDGQQQQHAPQRTSASEASPLIAALTAQGSSSTTLDDLDEPKLLVSKRTALFMDKLMVALHNAINGNRVPPMSSPDLEVVQRQKNTLGAQQLLLDMTPTARRTDNAELIADNMVAHFLVFSNETHERTLQ